MRSPHMTAFALSVVTALTLAGCSGQSWTLDGATVDKPADTLAAIEEGWRAQLADSGQLVAVPDDAACFYQVAAGGMLHPEVLCGPYRVAPRPDTSWDVVPIAGGYGDGGKVIPQQAGDAFEGGPTPGTELVRPDGRTANLDATVDLPALEAGAVHPLAADPAGRHITIQGPEDVVTVTVTDAAPTLADADGEWVAADGVSLIGLRMPNPNSHAAAAPVTFRLEAGGATYELVTAAEQTGRQDSHLNLAVAVPGDGADAVLVADFEGQRQQLVPLNGDPVVPVVFRQEWVYPGRVQASFMSKIDWTSEDKKGWAAPGRAWLQITIDRVDVDWKKVEVEVDGKKVTPVDTKLDTRYHTFTTLLFDVPDTALSAVVDMPVSESRPGQPQKTGHETVTIALQPAR